MAEDDAEKALEAFTGAQADTSFDISTADGICESQHAVFRFMVRD